MFKKTLVLLVAAIGILQVRCATISTEPSTDASSTSTPSTEATEASVTTVSIDGTSTTFTRATIDTKIKGDVSTGQNITENNDFLNGKGVPCTRYDHKGPTYREIDINGSGGSETLHYCPTEPKLVERREGCGWRNPKGIGLTLLNNNDTSEYGELPWVIAILSTESLADELDVNVYRGGGSLIHPSVVLTAAHIVAKHSNVTVRAGEWDTQTLSETYPHQDRNVSSREIHDKYDKNNLYYDVALLFLEKPFDLAPNVGVACLPLALKKVQPETRCLASGWGKDQFGRKGQYQVILKKVELPVVEHEDCQERLRTTRLSKRFKLHSTFMCAGGEVGKDTCTGDGGSPLVCPTEVQDQYVQYGMVA